MNVAYYISILEKKKVSYAGFYYMFAHFKFVVHICLGKQGIYFIERTYRNTEYVAVYTQ